MRKTITIIGAVLVGALVIAVAIHRDTAKTPVTPAQMSPRTDELASAIYRCEGFKTIRATFFTGEPIPPATPDMPPTPGGSVQLTLSNGASMTLPQTISADGSRYATVDESFIFWDKGSRAIVLENGAEKTYRNCIKQ